MSEQSFCRFFSKMMGRPFFTFLNEYRINMASHMLLDTDWTVAEISFAAGFESPAFFHKQFNKYKKDCITNCQKRHYMNKLIVAIGLSCISTLSFSQGIIDNSESPFAKMKNINRCRFKVLNEMEGSFL